MHLCNRLPHSCKGSSCVDIFLVAYMWDINQNSGPPKYEAVNKMLLECWQIIRNIVAPSHTQWIVAVWQQNGLQLTIVVDEVAHVNVLQLYFLLMPCATKKNRGKEQYSVHRVWLEVHAFQWCAPWLRVQLTVYFPIQWILLQCALLQDFIAELTSLWHMVLLVPYFLDIPRVSEINAALE